MKERYVNFEVAKLLKDKSFNEYCHKTYDIDNGQMYIGDGISNNELTEISRQITAPTQQMACDWIEKKHNYIIDVHLDVESEETSSWVWSVYERINVEGREPYARLYFEDDKPYEFDNQEFAYNEALKYVLTKLV